MKKEFSNAKSTKTRNLSKLLLAVILSVVLFGGAMFLLFANHTAPISTALAVNSLETLPAYLDTAPTFTYDSSAGTVTGTDQTINGYNFKDDVYKAEVGSVTLGEITYTNAVTLKQYTPTTPTQVVIPSQMIINGNTYQVITESRGYDIDQDSITDAGIFLNNQYVEAISFAGIGETKVVASSCICMFYNCTILNKLDLSGLDTSKVKSMNEIFSGCSSLTNAGVNTAEKTFNLNFGSNFDTSKVTDMGGMFYNCSNLTNLDLSSFNTSSVTDMHGMFYNCFSLNSAGVNTAEKTYALNFGPNFDAGNVKDMSFFFAMCGFTELNLSSFKTDNVTDIGGMFFGCSSLTSLDLSSFDTSNVTKMDNMFYGCFRLTSLDLSSFDTSNVISMYMMFSYCSSITSLDLKNFNTSNVTDMVAMFTNINVDILNLSSFVFKADCNVEDMFGTSGVSDSELADVVTMYCGDLGLDPVADADKISSIPFSCFDDENEYNTTENKHQYFSDLINIYVESMIELGMITTDRVADHMRNFLMMDIEAYFDTFAQIQSIILPASVNGLSIALPASDYAVNGTDEYAYTTLKGYNDFKTANGTSYTAGATLQNKALVPETPTSTGVETDLLFALSGAVVVALFALAVAHVGKRKRFVKK